MTTTPKKKKRLTPEAEASRQKAKLSRMDRAVDDVKEARTVAKKKRTSDLDETPKRKRSVVDITPTKKVKKKRPTPTASDETDSTSTQLALIRSDVVAGNKRISKLKNSGVRSIIGDSAEDIQQLLEVGSNESALSLIQKRLLQSVIDVLPFAEHTIRETQGQRGVYQFNSLITSMRELMIDMQSTRDKGAMGAALIERVLRPAFMDLAMTLVQEEARFATNIKDYLPMDAYTQVRQANKDAIQRVAESIKEKYNEVKEQTVSYLQG